ncbi:hypothetical protein HPODL_05201 [Ogataea parapolymorpha DL-1]|uniref:Zn(2)-C6 fungal-type domain-containing protein n=1 Tax=Ogataea parapolymorpha (strain ATCC 26012 / BCRC 20466 / JCM 22074 / NRRL Y-7560 / DL-1) TaxID=871575 RepID=W1QF16_OGAPD|nr:hypothetical protein HPODL_05201 [Ogataea parapolymorpha DL-1]ESW99602.1 hypothetical protein HPODL_05201 [Ogataea parapolymorpha DL-1]
MSKSRTKSGCFTCRKRKKKCDERFPVCSGCSRNFLHCSWPEKRGAALPRNYEIKAATSPPQLPQHDPQDPSEYPIPSHMCFVFELDSYKHQDRKIAPRFDILTSEPALDMLVENAPPFSWIIVAIHTLHALETNLRELLDAQTLRALAALPDSHTVLNVFVRNFPIALFFCNTSKLPSPYEFYQHSFNFISLVDVPFACDWHVGQQRALLLESLETLAKLADAKTTKLLAPVKHKMTLTWTAIQTLEIQIPLQDLTPGQRQTQRNLAVCKALFYAQEILYLKLADASTEAGSPVVQFYLEQLVAELGALSGNSLTLLLFPLLIGGCVALKMAHREFFSKELHILAQDQQYPLARKMAEKLEDLWCEEEQHTASAYQWLISTCGP